jgi:hypothetical protein
MTNRELVISVVNRLPANARFDVIIGQIEFVAGVKQGLAEAEKGEGISCEEARRLIEKWTSNKSRHPERSEAKIRSSRKARRERSRRTRVKSKSGAAAKPNS